MMRGDERVWSRSKNSTSSFFTSSFSIMAIIIMVEEATQWFFLTHEIPWRSKRLMSFSDESKWFWGSLFIMKLLWIHVKWWTWQHQETDTQLMKIQALLKFTGQLGFIFVLEQNKIANFWKIKFLSKWIDFKFFP